MSDGPLVAVETATAEADEGGLLGKAVAGGQLGVERFPVFDGCGAAEHIGDFQRDDVVAFAKKGDVGCGFVAKEFAVPDPGFAWGGFFGSDDGGQLAADFEFVLGVAIPIAGFTGEKGGLRAGETAGLGVEFGGFSLGLWERQAGFDAGALVAGLGEPSVAQQGLLLFDESEDGRTIWVVGCAISSDGQVPVFEEGAGHDEVTGVVRVNAVFGKGEGGVGLAGFCEGGGHRAVEIENGPAVGF